MKKFVYVITGLSAAGAFIAGVLAFQHYNPDSPVSQLFCGGGLASPCRTLSQSGLSTLFEIPVASYGLVFYLLVLFIVLIADYAEGRYYAYSVAALLPLTAAAVAVDVALGVLLIYARLPCFLCMATYPINLGMLAAAILWYRKLRADELLTLPSLYRELFAPGHASPDRKAFYASFVLFAFLLPFCIFSTSVILELRSAVARSADERGPAGKISAYIAAFYNQPRENIQFPDTGMVVGNPDAKLEVVVFTDFLCSFCDRFYQVEEALVSKYGSRIKIVYYNFPLDRTCNPGLSRTVYRNSCIAARALLAASEAGILAPYMKKHFLLYHTFAHSYDARTPLEVLGFMDAGDRKGIEPGTFRHMMDSPKTARLLNADIRLADRLGINGTPTIFINNRKIDGYRPAEVLEAIINIELGRGRN
jgi:protein-disulfide isomerase/uncharacterized membrane protein